ncbi:MULTISPECIES: hypothetical protein [Acinetobacter]|uniref:hypothetical protein n=1 Tax=Acinetobacter TaxID=469 RepID=UPI000A350347|nr:MULTISPECIES: hypothetical protein [Acinetobacter]MBJ8434557.1 hypothetical protein [Acinetobacter pittii]MBJ9937135.1 hypothetical protein [Acinetobacter pittii]MDS7924660.1 hypothetical protein [Acinetobacter sp. V115_6]MDS7956283.1 hypothetical protein [Acinetobacter sp. V104_13]MDS7984218.1 hypothetical protein [Acinetobacter sp. V104_3]
MFLKMYIFSYFNAQLIVPSCLSSKWKLKGEKMDLDNNKNHVNQSKWTEKCSIRLVISLKSKKE